MNKNIRIIGVPLDLGQSHRGVDMGPGALRYAGLDVRLKELGFQIQDIGNLHVPIRESLINEEKINYLPSVQSICELTYEAAQKAIQDKTIPIFLGGDHSLAIGSVGGVSHDEPVGVIWVDAHGDFNTSQTSPTGNIHGMPLAVLLGQGSPELINLGRSGPKISPTDVVLIGIRDLDVEERRRLKNSGIKVYTMRDIDERGMNAISKEALELLKHRKRLHVSIDMDSLDPEEAPGVGTPAPGGLTYREAHYLMEVIADTNKVTSMDIVEINPILDIQNKTAELAVELVASLLGSNII